MKIGLLQLLFLGLFLFYWEKDQWIKIIWTVLDYSQYIQLCFYDIGDYLLAFVYFNSIGMLCKLSPLVALTQKENKFPCET
jgi:hypothetical protein